MKIKIKTKRALLAAVLAAGLSQGACFGPYMLLPDDPEPPPLLPISMVRIAPGNFVMGQNTTPAPAGYPSEMPYRTVSITRGFYMSEHPVMRALWMRIAEWGNTTFEDDILNVTPWPDYLPNPDDPYNKTPASHMSWYDAIVFANLLSMYVGLIPVYIMFDYSNTFLTGNPAYWGRVPTADDTRWDAVIQAQGSGGFRLPTEAEWEFAARAGTTSLWNTGDALTSAQANIDGTVKMPAGSFPPNAWGLFDMHGNVSELVWDWLDLHNALLIQDPTGPAARFEITGGFGLPALTGYAFRVARGGSYALSAEHARSTTRGHVRPYQRDISGVGFRLVRTVY